MEWTRRVDHRAESAAHAARQSTRRRTSPPHETQTSEHHHQPPRCTVHAAGPGSEVSGAGGGVSPSTRARAPGGRGDPRPRDRAHAARMLRWLRAVWWLVRSVGWCVAGARRRVREVGRARIPPGNPYARVYVIFVLHIPSHNSKPNQRSRMYARCACDARAVSRERAPTTMLAACTPRHSLTRVRHSVCRSPCLSLSNSTHHRL
jgi:hypothetical protein